MNRNNFPLRLTGDGDGDESREPAVSQAMELRAATESSNDPFPNTVVVNGVRFTVADIMRLFERIKALEIEVHTSHHHYNQVRDMLKHVNIKFEETKAAQREMQFYLAQKERELEDMCKNMRDLENRCRQISLEKQQLSLEMAVLRTTLVPLTPRPSDEIMPTTPKFPGSRTYTTPATRRLGNVATTSGRGSGARRHKRTQTPTQNHIRKMTGGEPVYTMGLEKQDDRGLIADFFDSVFQWAREWTQTSRLFSADEIALLTTPKSAVCEFLGSFSDTTDAAALVSDSSLRGELIAAVVTNNIVLLTMCDTFLFDAFPSEQDAKLKNLWTDFGRLKAHEVEKKHILLLEQKEMYTGIKQQGRHREWRAVNSKEFALTLIDRLGTLLSDDPLESANTNVLGRDGALEELFVKGYRIGFRMRMAAEKWSMNWPAPGDDFNADTMVNESRYLHGNAIKTLERVNQSPGAYTVRFGKSPTITRADYSSGQERRELVHKGLVYLVRKPATIGTERAFFTPTRAGHGRGTGHGTNGGF